MRFPADSLILACANLAVTRCGYVSDFLHIGNSLVGTMMTYMPILASPVLLLATVIYLPRDLIRRGTRFQALAAVALSVPCVLFLRSIEL